MEKMIVVVFDNEPRALEGLQILRDLDSEGDISLYEAEVVAKEPTGLVRVIDSADKVTVPMIVGATAVGALVGLVGGPVGAIVGATGGALIGSVSDIDAGLTEEFVSDVTKALTPGKVAVIADIAEELVTPLDERMEKIRGVVFRRIRTFAENTQEDRDMAAHQAEMEQLKAERAQTRSDRLAKIDARIDHLRIKLENAIERKRIKMQLRQQQREAKIQALQAKANQTYGEARRRQEARITELRSDYVEKAAVG